ncbi:MAG: PaaI family thioesterase [Hellea sp.]|nr:PaaI family thioesterase [Hellea sp.]
MDPLISKISVEDLNKFFQQAFAHRAMEVPETVEVESGRAVVKMKIHPDMLRPGGFISGPAQMALADHAAYVAIFTQLGLVPMALTSSLSIDFLRPCQGESLIADARIAKRGRSLVVINVEMKGASSDKVSSQAVVTYALPKE